jgi:hypothetical protein
MKDRDLVLFLTAFGEVELTNAVELRLFRKEISRAEISAAHRAFEEDLTGGILVLKAVPAAARLAILSENGDGEESNKASATQAPT